MVALTFGDPDKKTIARKMNILMKGWARNRSLLTKAIFMKVIGTHPV